MTFVTSAKYALAVPPLPNLKISSRANFALAVIPLAKAILSSTAALSSMLAMKSMWATDCENNHWYVRAVLKSETDFIAYLETFRLFTKAP